MSSRRLLGGEVPHRDFITEKPALSAMLHMPEVAFGGDYTFWISRYVVWLQFAIVSWAWAEILTTLLLPAVSARYKAAFALLAFIFCSNTFPPIAWHTVDALFFLSLGLALRIRFARLHFPAYFLIGSAYLCKQTFAAAFIGVLIATGDWRRLKCWVAALLPGALYACFLGYTSALSDAIVQLTAQRGIYGPGLASYVKSSYFLAGALGGLCLCWLIHQNKKTASSLVLWVVSAGLCICSLGMSEGMFWFGLAPGFALFGLSLGMVIPSLLLRERGLPLVRAGVLVLTAAWCASISIGFNSPALAAGLLACFMLIAAIASARNVIDTRHITVCVVAVLTVSVAAFIAARREWVYRDTPPAKLTGKLDDIFPGARNIKTNPNTLAYLRDLQSAIGKAHNRPYIILPDTAAYWVRSGDRNPISSDWPSSIELADDRLTHRVERDLQQQKGKAVILLQKVSVEDLPYGFNPLNEAHYPILPFVHNHFRKIDETTYFYILE